MADEVIIGNVGGQDGVASEATLQALVRAIEKMGNQRGQRGAGSKVQDLHNKAVEAGTTATTTQTVSVKKNTEEVKKNSQAASNLAKGFGALAMRGVGQVMASLAGMTKSLLAGEDSMQAYASQIPIFGSLLGSIAGYLDRSVDAFREMSSVGAGFNNDILAMRKTAAANNLTLEEFSTVVRNNSEILAALGGTVTGGVQRFTAMNQALKETGTFEQLKGMGFSIADINEGMADYLNLQNRLGRLQGKSTQELAAGAGNYLKELDQLAKLTGKSRKEMADMQERQASDASFRALANQFKEGSKEAENFRKNMALIETLPADVATGLKDLADGIPQTEEGIALLNAAGPELAEAMKRVGQGADPQVLLDAMKKAGGDIEKFSGLEGQQRAAYISALRQTNPALAGVLDAATRMTALGNRDLKAAEAEQNKRNEVTQKLTTFQDAIRKMSEAIQVAFVDSGILELFAEGVGQAARLITGMADSIKAFTERAKIEGFIPALVGLMGDAIKGLFSNTTVIAGLVAAIGALFLAKAVVGALGRGFSDVADKAASKMLGGFGSRAAAAAPGASIAGNAAAGAGGAVKAAPAGKGFGEAIGNIGKGIGEGIGGVLKGLASGLAAFANPAILIGAGILGGAILAIGAAIAGATWIIGKALPTFAEGMKSFAELDGDNLIQVGKGIAAISLAMATMGASSVVAGVGGMLGGLAEGITSLFGGKTPFDKLEEFSKYNIDAAKVESNANAVVAYSKAMASLGAAGAVGSLGNLVSSVADGLSKFFGGEVQIPWNKVQAFQTVTLDAKKIQANSTALKAFSEAMANIPSVSGERTGGLIGAVASFFSGSEQVPWAQAIAFGQINLPVDKIKSNSEAMVAFNAAMNTMGSPANKERTGGLIGAVGTFFLGAQQVPWAQAVAFGQLTLPADKIKSNAEAMAAFGEAMSKVPQINPTRSGGLLEGIKSFFAGGQVMPWDNLKQFGELRIDAPKIKANAEALASFGSALESFKGTGQGNAISIPADAVANLGRLGAIGSQGSLQQTAAGLQAIANVQNLQTTLTSLNALDATKIISYNTALKDLTKVLTDLNKELANENRGGLFGMGDAKANAGEILKSISVNTSAGAGNTGQLNDTLMKVIEVLQQTKEINDKIEKNTKRGVGADVASRDISAF